MRRLFGTALLVSMLSLPSTALAWDEPQRWFESASGADPGGGGIVGTSGVADHGITCAACHVGAKGGIGVSLTFSPPVAGMTYAPGQRYQVSANLTGEHLGLSGCGSVPNVNTFAATFEHAIAGTAGALASDGNTSAQACQRAIDPQALSGTTVVYGDCRSVEGFGANRTAWTFTWTAPPQGSGPVFVTFGAVDGNCGADSLGDDVATGVVYLDEAKGSGAAAQGNSALPWAAALVPLLALVHRLTARGAPKRFAARHGPQNTPAVT